MGSIASCYYVKHSSFTRSSLAYIVVFKKCLKFFNWMEGGKAEILKTTPVNSHGSEKGTFRKFVTISDVIRIKFMIILVCLSPHVYFPTTNIKTKFSQKPTKHYKLVAIRKKIVKFLTRASSTCRYASPLINWFSNNFLFLSVKKKNNIMYEGSFSVFWML